eukprot:12369115-Ditylum_brightwellii.AAC.1
MPSKVNYTKKPIYFKLAIGNRYQKTFLPVSKLYNGMDKIDKIKMNNMFENVFNTCSTQMKQNHLINNETDYSKDMYSKSSIMQEYNNGPIEEYTLSNKSFIHYINQMIEHNAVIRVCHKSL